MSPHNEVAAPARWRQSLSGTVLVAALVAMFSISGVAAASNGASSTTLKVGSTGAAVKQLQRKLHVSATGYYGSQTAGAVKRYQRTHHLSADGVAGPATLRALGVRVRAASYSSGGASYQPGSGSSTRVPAALQRIARCESGGNPRAISRDGRYRGKYQFDRSTWARWGGTGDAAASSEAAQDRVAIKLYRARGTSPWPSCG